MLDWSGIFHILATPFRADGSLDVEGLPHLVESVLGTGVSGLTVLGIAGEAHRLTDEERRAAMAQAARQAAHPASVPHVLSIIIAFTIHAADAA